MFTVILVVHAVICVLLVLLVLMQSTKGAGLSEAFGGGGGTMQTLFGVKSTNVLAKITIALAILFLVSSLLVTVVGKRQSVSIMEKVKIIQETEENDNTANSEKEAESQLPLNPGAGPIQ